MKSVKYLDQPYIATLNQMQVRAGTVTEVAVHHDRDCERPNGGPCTCAPDVVQLNRAERRAMKRKGMRR